MSERWLPVVGYEGLYEVSSRGRVRSLDRVVSNGARYRGRIRKLVPASGDVPYPTVMLSRASRMCCFKVHALVLTAFRGPRPESQEARHRNGRCADNRLGNLVWGTPKQNGRDRLAHGTQLHGESVPTSKLRAVQVRRIRVLLAEGNLKQREIAAYFGCKQQQISRINTGAQWART